MNNNTNLINYRIGVHVLIRRNDWGDDGKVIEVEIMSKSITAVKVRFCDNGWSQIGYIQWLNVSRDFKEFWYAWASVKKEDKVTE